MTRRWVWIFAATFCVAAMLLPFAGPFMCDFPAR